MAMHKNEEIEEEEQNALFVLDSLYCDEEKCVEDEEDEESEESSEVEEEGEEEEFLSLISKEKEEQKTQKWDSVLCLARSEAVKWILRVSNYHGFSGLTAILAVNYLDRFLSSSQFQREKPWMSHLAAVSCLSLAAKVEETHAPFLLDLQVEETKYVFEGKTIQRMELLVLSTLQWKMNPVTPYSFMDLITRKIGLKINVHFDHLLLSLISDSRSVSYLPSVMAAATVARVLDQIELCKSMEYKNRILGILKISKEKVNECYNLILELSKIQFNGDKNYRKRRIYQVSDSPNGVADSWSVLSSSPEPPLKKIRAQTQVAEFPSLIT